MICMHIVSDQDQLILFKNCKSIFHNYDVCILFIKLIHNSCIRNLMCNGKNPKQSLACFTAFSKE